MSFCRCHWQHYLQLTGKICFACKSSLKYLIRSIFMQTVFLFCYYLYFSIHKLDVHIMKYYTNRPFQLGWFVFTLQTTWYSVENSLIIHIHATIWEFEMKNSQHYHHMVWNGQQAAQAKMMCLQTGWKIYAKLWLWSNHFTCTYARVGSVWPSCSNISY